MAVCDLLKATGAFTPWENLALWDEGGDVLRWDQTPPSKLQIGQRGLDVLNASYKNRSIDEIGLLQDDPLDAQRKDWGKLPVYVIDDASAQELDDGISIEPAPPVNQQQTWWVHVHVADPTALLGPSTQPALLAMQRAETRYMSEQTYPMLSDAVLRSGRFSLGDQSDRGQRVLTISSHIRQDGEVLATKVQPAIARNVVPTTYELVNDALGHIAPDVKTVDLTTHPNQTMHELEPDSRAARHTVIPKDGQLDDLRQLAALSLATLKKRAQSTLLIWNPSTYQIHMAQSDLRPSATLQKRPDLYTGLPAAVLKVPGPGAALDRIPSHYINPAQTLVSEMMIQANRAVSAFGVERDIPMGRSVVTTPTGSSSQLQHLLSLRNPSTGAVSYQDFLAAGSDIKFTAGYISTRPGPQWMLGIQDQVGYVKATSPLRRYPDLLTHWQLRNSFLNDQRSSAEWLAVRDLGMEVSRQGAPKKRFSKRADTFRSLWALNVIRNRVSSIASTSDEAGYILSNLTAVIVTPATDSIFASQSQWRCHIVELGMSAFLTVKTSLTGKRYVPGETVAVKIQDIDLRDYPRLLVEPRM